jgi:hypothetical protein
MRYAPGKVSTADVKLEKPKNVLRDNHGNLCDYPAYVTTIFGERFVANV